MLGCVGEGLSQLEVWRRAHQLVLSVYRATNELPKAEVLGITSQLGRVAVAVPSRIAEGCGRNSDVESAAALQKARATASELEYLLLLSRDLGYLTEEDHHFLGEEVVSVREMMSGLLKRLPGFG